jgi:predicted RNA-binding protein with PIN domain
LGSTYYHGFFRPNASLTAGCGVGRLILYGLGGGEEMPYLIDGNNLLGSWGGPVEGDDRRGEVVRRVLAFCRKKNVKATIVFDGHPLRHDLASQDLGPVSIRVPPTGEDADGVIRDLVERSAHPREIFVVTSDKALGSTVKLLGASVVRAHEWNTLERRLDQDAPPPAEKPEREDDVEGWLKTFGPG